MGESYGAATWLTAHSGEQGGEQGAGAGRRNRFDEEIRDCTGTRLVGAPNMFLCFGLDR